MTARTPTKTPSAYPLALLHGLQWAICLALLLGVLTVALNTGLLALAAYLIAAAALQPLLTALSVPLALVRFTGVSRAFVRYAERLVSHDLTFRLLARLRTTLYSRLTPLIPARLLAFHSGDLLARLVDDVEELENFYGRVLTPLAIAALSTMLTGLALWSFSPLLGLVVVGCLTLGGLLLPALALWQGNTIGRQQVAARAALQTTLVDSLQGMPDLLALGRAADQSARVAALDQHLGGLQRRMAWITGLQNALSDGLAYGATTLILVLAIPQASNQQFGAVYLAMIALIVLGASEAVTPLGRAFAALGRSRTASDRIFALINAEPATTDPPVPQPLVAAPLPLRFEQVSFHYAAAEGSALHDITFTIAPGEHVALVGPSGAGKSTVVQLLLRFWDPCTGTIHLGDHHLRDYAQDDLRRTLAVAQQDGHLFAGTLRTNLLLARPTATDAELDTALTQVGLAALVRQWPQGLDTWLGEHGVRLSGGERQRVILARALIRNARLLILDEPTAHLDRATEAAVFATIHQTQVDRSLLVITHRLVQMTAFDTILVLADGAIVERGTHATLLAQCGLYAQLYEAQAVDTLAE